MRYPKEYCLEQLRQAAKEYGGRLTVKQYVQSGRMPKYSYMIHHHGSWSDLCRAANILPIKFATTDEIIKRLRKTLIKIGYVPSSLEYMKMRCEPPYVSIRRAGLTWKQAINLAGYVVHYKPNTNEDRWKICRICLNQYKGEHDCHRLKNHAFLDVQVVKIEGVVPPLVSHGGFAQALGISKQALTDRRKRGTIPEPDTMIDGRPYWLKSTVDRTVKEKTPRN